MMNAVVSHRRASVSAPVAVSTGPAQQHRVNFVGHAAASLARPRRARVAPVWALSPSGGRCQAGGATPADTRGAGYSPSRRDLMMGVTLGVAALFQPAALAEEGSAKGSEAAAAVAGGAEPEAAAKEKVDDKKAAAGSADAKKPKAEAAPAAGELKGAPKPSSAEAGGEKKQGEGEKKKEGEKKEGEKKDEKKKPSLFRNQEVIKELKQKEAALVEKSKLLYEQEQSIEVLSDELELERKVNDLLRKQRDKAIEESKLIAGLCGQTFLP